jgi:hypothetical protein
VLSLAFLPPFGRVLFRVRRTRDFHDEPT